MDRIGLGRRGPKVSRICMECMGLGNPSTGQHSWTVDGEPAEGIVKAALDAGIDFFDTAPGYQDGTSERILGKAVARYADRGSVFVATKFLPRSQDEISAGIGGREHVLRSLDASLERLGTDYVDLLIYHMWDYATPLEEIMCGLRESMDSGKADRIGISNCYAWQLCEANALADAMGMDRFVSVQNHHNLVFREEEREMMPYCRHAGIAVTPYSPLASGRLSRPAGVSSNRFERDSYAHLKYDASAEADSVIIDRVRQVAERLDVSMTQVAIAWSLTKVTAPVVGATSPGQIEDAASAADLRLSDDDIGFLEEPYMPHRIVGVMAQNTPDAVGKKQVWDR